MCWDSVWHYWYVNTHVVGWICCTVAYVLYMTLYKHVFFTRTCRQENNFLFSDRIHYKMTFSICQPNPNVLFNKLMATLLKGNEYLYCRMLCTCILSFIQQAKMATNGGQPFTFSIHSRAFDRVKLSWIFLGISLLSSVDAAEENYDQ